ncbi:hypothetical protein [Vallitalea guaymasensis]|uniref:hypothetical protein n=1 Tax=Vallitalea guaymasensis TaxID=1185412 RepID=UPI000DE3BE91|nr:hypothetical protein [Vallitalea guaymasensis]
MNQDYNTMRIDKLVDEFTKQHKAQSEAKKEMETIKAELQKRGLKQLEDKNLKTIQFWGNNNNYALVQKTEDVEMQDYITLSGLLKNVTSNCITKTQEVEYKFDKKFKEGITAVFTKNYETRDLEDILKEMKMNNTQIELAKKKLKGTWIKDKEFLESVGVDEEVKNDIEVYLYFIHQSMNYRKLVEILTAAGYDKEEIPLLITKLKKTILVKENTRIGCSYK